MNDPVQTLMQDATRLTREGRLAEATEAIQRALRSTSPAGAGAHREDGDSDSMVIDGCVFEVAAAPPASLPMAAAFQPGPTLDQPLAPPAAAPAPQRTVLPSGPGEFLRGVTAGGPLRLAYKLYVPPDHAGRSLPLVVMLHGCTQHADDFAAGTGMNERARDEGFFVLYPEQSAKANPQACWNWFKPNHQARGRGEPAAIVEATQEVMHRYGIDARRVYIAGLSAGGAMAHIVALAYPEVFAAVGVHSGLPCGAAANVSEALGAMKGGAAPRSLSRSPSRVDPARPGSGERPPNAVPTIVFHGDRDTTVHPRNGEQVIAAARGPAQTQGDGGAVPPARTERGVSRHGKPYTRSISSDARGHVWAEHWVVHGAGHAWSGGRAAGSYTDAQGPDATGEMLRFFRDHPRA